MTAKLAYRVAEAAEMLGISRSKVYELIASGRLRSVKCGRIRLITHEALVEYLASLEQDAVPPASSAGRLSIV